MSLIMEPVIVDGDQARQDEVDDTVRRIYGQLDFLESRNLLTDGEGRIVREDLNHLILLVARRIESLADCIQSREALRSFCKYTSSAQVGVEEIESKAHFNSLYILCRQLREKSLENFMLIVRNRFVDRAYMQATFFAGCLTDDSVHRQLRKISRHFHPDAVSLPRLRPLAQEILVHAQQTAEVIIREGSLDSSQGFLARLQHYRAEGNNYRKLAVKYKSALKAKENNEAMPTGCSELIFFSIDQLKFRVKESALCACQFYRSAIKIADSHAPGQVDFQIELRKFIAISYFLAGHVVEAQLYIIAALHVATDQLPENDLPDALKDLKKYLDKIRGAPHVADNYVQSQDTPASPPPEDSNALVEVLQGNLMGSQLVAGTRGFRHRARAAIAADSDMWITAQAIRPDGAVARYECTEEEIVRAQSQAITYYTSAAILQGGATVVALVPILAGVTLALEGGGVIAAGSTALMLAFAGGPVSIGIVSVAFIACAWFSYDLFGRAAEAAREPERRTKLNSIITTALSHYNSGRFEEALGILSETYVDQTLINFRRGHSIRLDADAIITKLLDRNLRADGIAFIMNMIAEVLVSGSIRLETQSQADLNGLAKSIYRAICDNEILQKNADDLDRRVFLTRTKVGYSTLQWFRRHKLSTVEGVPEAYFTDAQEAPFFVRLTEIRNIARMNLAIMFVLERSDPTSLSRAREMFHAVQANIHNNFQYFSVNEKRLEALEDFLSALGVQLEQSNAQSATIVTPSSDESWILKLGHKEIPCFSILTFPPAITLGQLADQLFGSCDSHRGQWSNDTIATLIDDYIEEENGKMTNTGDGNIAYCGRDTSLHAEFLHILRTEPDFQANDFRLVKYFQVLMDCCKNIAWIVCTKCPKTKRLLLSEEHNRRLLERLPNGGDGMLDNNTIFVVLDSTNSSNVLTATFKANVCDSTVSIKALNDLQSARNKLLEARICSGIRSVKLYANALKEFQTVLESISFSWAVLLQTAQVARIYDFYYETQLISTVTPSREITAEEIESLAGLLECLVRMGKLNHVLGLMIKVREIEKAKEVGALWYWFAVAARKARLYYDASYAIQQSLRFEPSNSVAGQEREIIGRLKANKITSPVFNSISQKVILPRAIDYTNIGRKRTVENQFYDILAFDGGGIRGIMPARIIAEVEFRSHLPIYSLVSMQAGTSTGSIIAAALSTPARHQTHLRRPITAGDVVALYANPQNHKHIFRQSMSLWGFLGAKYGPERERVLSEVLGPARLTDALNDLLIVAVDDSHQMESHCFTTFDARKLDINNVGLVDAVMASSAAPTFFPSHKIGNIKYIDGGLQANNPAHLAVTHATSNGHKAENVRVWSLGTGDLLPDPYKKGSQNTNFGALYWVSRAHETAMAGQQGNVDAHLTTMLGDRYNRWQVWLDKCIGLDDYQENAIAALVENAMQFIEENDDKINACINSLLLNRGYDPIN